MKITSLSMVVVSSLLFVGAALADNSHDADKAVESSLRATLNERHVHFHVHKGIVTLEGRVSTEADRQRLESVVRNTTGVVAVDDKLKVSLPSPGAVGGLPSVPVFTTPLPEIVPTTPVVTAPPPAVIVPGYPKIKVQAFSADDEPTASRIARQLRVDGVPTEGFENVVITVRGGKISLKGSVGTKDAHDDIIAAIQRTPGVTAIYDQMQEES